jgi:hypothetical protein
MRKKKVINKSEHKCSDCANAIAIPTHLSMSGEPLLAACKFEKDYVLLSLPACRDNFIQK